MANDKISNMTAAAVAALTGTGAAVEVSTGIGGVPATKQGLLRDLRTAMFAGGTGYTASDPLVVGNLSASGTSTLTGGLTVGAGNYVALTSDNRSVLSAGGANNYDLFVQAHQYIRFGTNLLNDGLNTKVAIRPSGNVGINSVGSDITALLIGTTSATTTGTSQYGIYVNPVLSSGATTSGAGGLFAFSTDAASYTMTSGYGIKIQNATKGAGSTITTLCGLYIENQTAGTTNYAIYSAGGKVNLSGLPTSSAGLASGDIWANSNVLTVVP